MNEIKQQNYLKRDYQTIKEQLVQILKVYYPDQWQDFNSPSVGMSLVELLAYVSDLLSYHTDKKFNELFFDGVTESTAVFRMAKTFGYKPSGYRPAISLSDITIEVPTTANGPDTSYLPIFRPGVQLKGAGQIFETINEIDFSSDFSEEGTANRKIIPIFNSNQDILRYRITKREIIKAGITRIYSQTISEEDANTAFLEVTLPETNVLEVLNVITKPSTNLVDTPTYAEFNDSDIRFFEVEDLAQSTVFLEDSTITSVNGVKSGVNIDVPKRFMKEFMSDGSCKLTFGGGTPNNNAYESYLNSLPIGAGGQINVTETLDNDALGEKLPANSTLYIKYRIGGGAASNVGTNVLTQVGNINVVIAGSNPSTNSEVISSTRATNVIPAIGGAGLPTVDEVKQYTSANFASQKRGVTLSDYIARAYQMPGRFGAPFRIYGKTEDNKIKLYILTKDANGKLLNVSTNTIKNNLVNYLSTYRMVNDFIEINDGKVVNLSVEIDLFADKNFNTSEVKANAITEVKNLFDINKWQMNQNIYVSQITDLVRSVAGVINVIDVRFYNLEGGEYSSTIVSQASGLRELTPTTGVFRTEIEFIDNTIFSTPISMFEIRNPDTDIKVRLS